MEIEFLVGHSSPLFSDDCRLRFVDVSSFFLSLSLVFRHQRIERVPGARKKFAVLNVVYGAEKPSTMHQQRHFHVLRP